MIKLMLITNAPDLARFAVEHGVQRIFVDLEVNGKKARQGHRDTLISNHSLEDVRAVRTAIPFGELLVRVNPLHEGSEQEVESAVSAGADLIMLPMFTCLEDIRTLVKLISGRCRFIPLIETPQAVALADQLVVEPGVDELFVGLNDLHLALGLEFMFQLVTNGTVERIASLCKAQGMPFGFGGIARMEEGLLPGRLVLAEHCRLGSSAVILSRTFHRAATSLGEMRQNLDFEREIFHLREVEALMNRREERQVTADSRAMAQSIEQVLVHLRQVKR